MSNAAPEPAPLVARTPAFLIDQLVVTLLVVPPVLVTGVGFEELISPGTTRRNVYIALMAVAFIYHFVLEWQTGQTVGKYVFDLSAVADDGTPLDIWQSLLRNALRGIDGLGYWGVAVAIILYRGDGKRLGDIIGRALVVRN